jgi:hypothetical protein
MKRSIESVNSKDSDPPVPEWTIIEGYFFGELIFRNSSLYHFRQAPT